MDRVLLNQKAVKMRKTLKQNQKDSLRGYYGCRSISKTKIGKLFTCTSSKIAGERVNIAPSEGSLDRLLELLETIDLSGMSGNGFSVQKKLELLLQHPSQKFLLINGVECEPGLLHDEGIPRDLKNA
ncbi:MAG: hypothetical protein JW780_03520 [Clostridiales bacterium]|nr:hypothetical protein [Clostridiales bacterium]